MSSSCGNRSNGMGRTRNSRRCFRPILRILEDRLAPATIQWDGGPTGLGTQWLDPVNWVGDVLPGPSDDAVVPLPAQPITLILDGDSAVQSATVWARLQCTAGTFTIGAGSSFFPRYIVLDGGTLNPLTGATLSGFVAGPGSFTNPNGVTLTLAGCAFETPVINNGTLVSSLGVVNPNYVLSELTNSANGVLRVQSGFQVRTLVNGGAIELVPGTGSSAILNCSSSTGLVNAPAGIIKTLAGAGGTRGLVGLVDNQGLIMIGANTAFDCYIGASINDGILDIVGGNLTVTQRQAGASFGNAGAVTVAAGRLLTVSGFSLTNTVGGSLTIDGSCTGAVVNNGSLAGSGTITGVVSGSGIFSPGSSPGILTVTGSFAGTGPLAIELNGPDVGTQYDRLKVNGSVVLSGPLSATLGFSPPPGQIFQIVENDGSDPIAGTFAGLPEGTEFAISGTTFRISYFGGTGNDVTLTHVDFGPNVSQVVVGDGTAQRSMVSHLQVVFDHIITYGSSPNKAYKLQKVVGGQLGGNVDLVIDTVTVGDHSEATLTFASDTTHGSLNDGRYRLNVIGERILSNGVPMTQDYVISFHRFFGDANGDGRVNIADLGLFSTTYGKHLGDDGYLAYFDYNGDGRVDAEDYGQFALRYLTRLP